MNDSVEQRIAAARALTLTREERSRLRLALVAAMATRPLSGSWVAFFARHALALGMAALVLVAGATGAVACWRAQPGDTLYPLRAAVSDRAALVLAPDDMARLDVELAQLTRTLDEEEQAREKEFRQFEQAEIVAATVLPMRTPSLMPTASMRPLEDARVLDSELRALERELLEAARDTLSED